MFLGFCNYYGHFLHHFIDIAIPPYTLLHKGVNWHWTDNEESTMHYLCAVLYSHPVHALPDFTKPFQIKNNASDTTVGGIFTQLHASSHKAIAFLSNILTSSEKTTVFIIVSCMQSLLVAKLSTPSLMGNKL